MKNYNYSILAALALVWLAFMPAQLLAAPVAGDSEVELNGGFFHSQGSDRGKLTADVHYGYYLTPGWEIGLRQGLNYDFIDDRRDFWVATTTPLLVYNFRFNDTFIPYLGGDIGLVWNDRTVSGTVGPNAGLKIFLTDQTYLNAGYRYQWFFRKFRDVDDNTNRGNHVVNIGIGFVWGGTRNPKP